MIRKLLREQIDEKILRSIKKNYIGKMTLYGPISDFEDVSHEYETIKNPNAIYIIMAVDGHGTQEGDPDTPKPEDFCKEIKERYGFDFIRYSYTQKRGQSGWY